MANLLGDLSSAARSLGAQQAGVQTAGRNLANVNTVGYARQRVVLGDRSVVDTPFGPQGSGVELLGVEQMRDQFLDATVTRELSHTALLHAQQAAFGNAQTALGETVDRSGASGSISDLSSTTKGISSALNNYFNAWEAVSANPSDTGARQVLLQKAATLADKINTADQRLAGLQGDLTTHITTDVPTVNGILKQIAELNKQIGAAEVQAPGSALDLRDQRQARLEELAKYMDFSTQPVAGSDGQIEVIAKDTAGGNFPLVQGTTVRGGLTFTGTGFTSGNPPVALSFQGGSLAGNLSARDGVIAGLRTDLKGTATQLAAAVNSAYNPGGTGSDFFQVPPTAGIIALDSTLTATTLRTSATGSSGANDIALAVGSVAQQKFSTSGGDSIDGTIGGFFNRTVTGLGTTIAATTNRLDDQQAVQQMASQQRDSVSGVSMDEEMADMMKYQRAYEASARVVRTLDDLLDTIVRGLSR